MFCPGCGIQTSDETKYCKRCGANLRGVQEVMMSRGEKFDWSKTWVAEMFLNEEERDRQKGITPEIKRLNEIKGGVITTLVGIGTMIFLYFLLGAVASQEQGPDREIISRVWLAGLIPFLIGIGLLINGLFVSKRIVKLKQQQSQSVLHSAPVAAPTGSRTTDQLAAQAASSLPDFSVTENTTATLPERVLTPPHHENR
ncbi:MAG TPA: hypothetical protein VNQ79_27465 [Blastocatellia bacterium]|nr:hypothetical protein [Blastocatellia bacterium]